MGFSHSGASIRCYSQWMTIVRKTPSYLKGLAETRARADGDVQRLQRIHEDIGQKLTEAIAERDACDKLIRKYDVRLNPELITPIRGWKGRYGRRGQLRESVLQLLQNRFPDTVTTTELSWELEIEFNLDFVTRAERKQWGHSSLVTALRSLVVGGKVERLHDISAGPTGEVGRWRWISDAALSLDHLREQATALGVLVQQADDVLE